MNLVTTYYPSHESHRERRKIERRRLDRRAPRLAIEVASGIGFGPTKLAAFDAALQVAGVANYNIIRLSSVIPKGSSVGLRGLIERRSGDTSVFDETAEDRWGHKLHAVYADHRCDVPGESSYAGIGWMQEKPFGRGLFVEHEGTSEEHVRSEIEKSLGGLLVNRHIDEPWPINMHIVGGTLPEPNPARNGMDAAMCALVIAPYETEGW